MRVAETGRRLGFITPLTHNFCESCNRVRLTCTGTLYMCLGQEDAADLRAPLRASDDDAVLDAAIREAIARKPKGHDFIIDRRHTAPRGRPPHERHRRLRPFPMADDDLRRNEVAVELPPADAGLVFIGTIRTPWPRRRDCPHGGDVDGPLCRIEVSEPWAAALDGIEASEWVQVLYWLHEARRDLLRQSPGRDGTTQGTFSLRSPLRPNPIGSSVVRLLRRAGSAARGPRSRLRRRHAALGPEAGPLPDREVRWPTAAPPARSGAPSACRRRASPA